MYDTPDSGDPVAYLPWWLNLLRVSGAIIVVVLPDDGQRTLILRREARRMEAPFLTCRRTRGPGQFFEFLSDELGIPLGRTPAFQRTETVARRLPRYVHFEQAELLTPTALGILLALKKTNENSSRDVSLVLSSGSRRLLQNIERADRYGTFLRHCCFYTPGVEPPPILEERRRSSERCGAAPPFQFPTGESD